MKKVLFIRFSSIGDIVLTTPLIRCVKQQIQGVEIHYLTKELYRPLLEGNPHLDKIITLRSGVRELIDDTASVDSSNTKAMRVIDRLRAEDYDFIVDLHKSLRSWQVLLMLGRPFGTFSKLNVRKCLLTKFRIKLLPGVHIVDRYFRAVKQMGVSNDGLGLDYYLSGPIVHPMMEKIHALEPYIALAIGGRHATKQMPVDKLTALCRKLDKAVVLVGGSVDRETGEAIVSAARQWQTIINSCGVLTLNESAAAIRDASLVITNDTGMMHIAAAFKKPVLSVWGNTVPAFGMYPYFPIYFKNDSMVFEVKNLRCRPCSKLGYDRCPKGHFRCMMEIDTDALADRANLHFSENRPD